MIFRKRRLFDRVGSGHWFRTLTEWDIYRRCVRVGAFLSKRTYARIVAQGFWLEKFDLNSRSLSIPQRGFVIGLQIGLVLLFFGLLWAYWPRQTTISSASTTVSNSTAQPASVTQGGPAQAAPTPAFLANTGASRSGASLAAAVSSSGSAPGIPAKRTQPIFDLGNGEAVTVPLTVVPPAPGSLTHRHPPTATAVSASTVEAAVQLPAGAPDGASAAAEATDFSANTSSSGESAGGETKETREANSVAKIVAALVDATANNRSGQAEAAVENGAASEAGATGTHDTATVAGENVTKREDTAAVSETGDVSSTVSTGVATAKGLGKPAVPEVAQPQPLPTLLVPGRTWRTFTPPSPDQNDHYWLQSPLPPGYNQLYSPNYQFGSTANGRYRAHHGVDISNPVGAPVLAVADGEVVHAGRDDPMLLGPYNNFYGNSVVIRLHRRLPTPDGEQDVYVLYGHLNEVRAARGQQVVAGDTIGTVGMTGIAIGPHLHLEVRIGQDSYLNTVNPALWLKPPKGTGSVAVRLLSASGQTWPAARLSLLRFGTDGATWVRQIEVYMDEENLGGDPAWAENGAMGNLPAGHYYITGKVNDEKVGQNLSVHAGQTTFIELRTQQ